MDPLQQMAPAPQSPAGLPPMAEATSDFSQTPMSPGMPGDPSVPTGPELSQEEMTANVEALMAKIKGVQGEFNNQKLSSALNNKRDKAQALQDVFEFFQSIGIDPSDVEAVRAFLDKLRQTNPEISQQVEELLQSLITDDSAPQGEITEPPVGPAVPPEGVAPEDMNINPNEAPQQSI